MPGTPSQTLRKLTCACSIPEAAKKLAGAFWPGPLTIVLRAKDLIPPIVLAGGRVAEEGSYDELIAKGGFFSEIIKRQSV